MCILFSHTVFLLTYAPIYLCSSRTLSSEELARETAEIYRRRSSAGSLFVPPNLCVSYVEGETVQLALFVMFIVFTAPTDLFLSAVALLFIIIIC